MKKRSLCFLLIAALLASVLPMHVHAASVKVAEWKIGNGGWNSAYADSSDSDDILEAFEDAWNSAMEAADDDHSKMMYFKLFSDWNGDSDGDLATYSFVSGCGFNWWAIYIQDGAQVTLDLNGHIINRRRTSAPANGNGEVIYVDSDASLTICDSNPDAEHWGSVNDSLWRPGGKSDTLIKGGIITGGYSRNGGGGIQMKGNSKVKLYGGTICGNCTTQEMGGGGGIEIDNDGALLEMYDGAAIMYNKADDNDGGGVEVYNGSFVMYGGEVSYNTAYDYGGGVDTYEDDGIAFVMKGGVIKNNKASYGGGVYIDSSVRIDGGGIIDNTATHDGGGIYFNDNDSPEVNKCDIVGNTANNNGGGIYVNTDDVFLCSLYMEENHAGNNGGAIYTDNDDCTITDSVINNNSAQKNGAGLFLYGSNTVIERTEISGNNAGAYGGGICIDDSLIFTGEYTVSDVKITNNRGNIGGMCLGNKSVTNFSGIITIKDNLNLLDNASNLYISEGSYFNTVGLNNKSEIWYGGYNGDSHLSSEADTHNVKPFICEEENYGLVWNNDPYDPDYRHIIEVSAEYADIKYEEYDVENGILETSEYTTRSSNVYDLLKGVYTYSSCNDSTKDNDAIFFYSDGYFEDEPTEYNSHLATMSMNMAMAGFYSSDGNFGTTYFDNGITAEYPVDGEYKVKHLNARKILANIGVDDNDIYVNEWNTQKPTSETIGLTIGNKELELSDGTKTGYTLVPIIMRGANYEKEWMSNVTLGSGEKNNGEAEGFSDAAEKAFGFVKEYIEKYGLSDKINEGKVKFWVMGYSRGGATANLLSKRLTDEYCDTSKYGDGSYGNKVFGYSFEAPQGGVDSAVKYEEYTYNGRYLNLHNCINKNDLVPKVGPSKMGFMRYGVDHYVPGDPEAGEVVRSEMQTTNDCSYTRREGEKFTRVITYSDNKPYLVKPVKSYIKNTDDADLLKYYNQRKSAEKQLNAIYPELVLDDYFYTADLNYVSALFYDFLEKAGDENKIPRMDEWLDDFIGDLIECSLPSREYFSTTKITIKKDDTTSLGGIPFEEAVRNTMGFVFDLSDEKLDSIVNSITVPSPSAAIKILNEGIDLWDDVLGDWDDISESKRAKHIDTLWKMLMEDFGIMNALTENEKTTFKKTWPVLADVLFRFVSEDYENELVDGIDETQAHLGTLLYNMNRIAANHYPEINLAWLRSYDSFYTTDIPGSDIGINSVVNIEIPSCIPAPAAKIDGVPLAGAGRVYGSKKIYLDTDTKGDAIFYSIVKTQPGAISITNVEHVYTDGITVENKADEVGGITYYVISAYSLEHGVKSAVKSYYVEVVNDFGICFDGDSISVNVPISGDYNVVAAKYNNNKLTDVKLISKHFDVGQTVLTDEDTEGLELEAGDKLMLLENFDTLRPLCASYKVPW